MVIINSEPQGATVYINGNEIGQTPIKRQLKYKKAKTDRYIIIVKKKGYMHQERKHFYGDQNNILFQLEKID